MSSVSCGFGIGPPPGAEAGQVIVVTDVEMSVKRAGLGILAAAAGAVVFATAAMPAAAGLSDPNPIVPQVPCYPDCQGADLRGRNAEYAQMPDGNFNEANLRAVDWIRANLSGSTFVNTNMYKAGLYGVDLTNADLSGADASKVSFAKANLTSADLSGADVSKANLRNANLTGANLTGADLSKANLKGANLTNADLSGVNFYKANFKDANLTGADITGADFRRAKFKNTICPNGTKTNKGC